MYLVLETFTDSLPEIPPGTFPTYEAAEAFLEAAASHAADLQWRQGYTPSGDVSDGDGRVWVDADDIGTVWTGRVIRVPDQVIN